LANKNFNNPDEHGIVDLSPANWDDVVLNSKYDVVVEFYNPYCGYCIDFKPTWDEIGDSFKEEDSVVICRFNVVEHSTTVPIQGVPAIILWPASKKDAYIKYSEPPRTRPDITVWILKNVDHPVEVNIVYKSSTAIAVKHGEAVEVVGNTWKDIVLDVKKDVFVNFYAPWCPFSRMLGPIWEEFARAMENYPTVVIARFDGTANQVPGLKLHAYPTLTLYKSGTKEEISYRTPLRTVEAFKGFLFEFAGIHPKTKEEMDSLYGDQLPLVDGDATKKRAGEKSAAQIAHDAEELLTFKVEEIESHDKILEFSNLGKNVVVLSYATWMDDEEEVLKKWKEIALEFRFVTSIKIFQTNGEKNPTENIHVYPTIMLYTPLSHGQHTFKGKELHVDNIGLWIREHAEKPPEEEELRKAALAGKTTFKSNKGGAFEGYTEKADSAEAGHSLIYKDDL